MCQWRIQMYCFPFQSSNIIGVLSWKTEEKMPINRCGKLEMGNVTLALNIYSCHSSTSKRVLLVLHRLFKHQNTQDRQQILKTSSHLRPLFIYYFWWFLSWSTHPSSLTSLLAASPHWILVRGSSWLCGGGVSGAHVHCAFLLFTSCPPFVMAEWVSIVCSPCAVDRFTLWQPLLLAAWPSDQLCTIFKRGFCAKVSKHTKGD